MNSMELNQLCQWADDLYQFVMVMMDHMKQPRDYGTGKILNMVEIHTLSMISESPGICISDVAKRWNRTLSAASRNIDRLAAKGYVEKKKTDGNGKTVHLYLTEKGQNLADLHRAYDLEKTEKFARLLARKYSMEAVSYTHLTLLPRKKPITAAASWAIPQGPTKNNTGMMFPTERKALSGMGTNSATKVHAQLRKATRYGTRTHTPHTRP